MKLSEFMQLSREERSAHIDLTTPCDLSRKRGISKKMMLAFFELENDIENWITGRIHRCHLCECGRGRGECSNPRHIYYGTPSENTLDLTADFRERR